MSLRKCCNLLLNCRLTEMEAEKTKASEEVVNKKIEEGTSLLIQFIPNNENSHLSVVKLNSRVEPDVEAPTVLVLPGVEGIFQPLDFLTTSLKAHVIGVQYNYKNSEDSIEELARNTLPVR